MAAEAGRAVALALCEHWSIDPLPDFFAVYLDLLRDINAYAHLSSLDADDRHRDVIANCQLSIFQLCP